MARIMIALVCISVGHSLQRATNRRALATPNAALQHVPSSRGLITTHAVSCPEADALLAQAKHLRDQAEIQERQLNALKAEATPQAVEGKNNILPLERLKAWRTRLSFEGNKVVSAAWTKFQEGGKAEVDGAEAGWKMYEDAHTAPTGAKVLECWFTQGETTYRLKTKATPRAEVEKLLKVEQDAFELIETLSKKLADAERRLADAKGPLDMIPRALARSLAMDELDMAYVVQKSCVAQAEPVRAGHFVDLDGRSYFISNRGEVESEGERGTFAAYVTN
jgi:hypothetical protein